MTDVAENSAPTAVALNPNSIAENNAAGATVGTLTTTDPDAGDTFTYSFAGGADDASFTIVDDKLNANAALDFETKSSYAIMVKSTDTGGLSVTQNLTVSVTDVNEASVASDDSAMTSEDTFKDIDVVTNDTDAESDNADLNVAPGSITAVKGGTTVLQADNRTVRFTPAADANDDNMPGGFGFSYKVTDGTAVSLQAATVSVTVLKALKVTIVSPQLDEVILSIRPYQ